MKKSIIIIAVLLMASFTTKVMAQGATASAPAAAEIFTPLTLTLQSGSTLDFGKMSVGGTLGTRTLTTANGNTGVTGSVNYSSAVATHVPTFLVDGQASKTYVITMLNASENVTHGSDVMTVTDFKFRTASSPSADGTTGTLHATTHNDSFTIGATLNVGANQATGVYAGTINPIVNYN